MISTLFALFRRETLIDREPGPELDKLGVTLGGDYLPGANNSPNSNLPMKRPKNRTNFAEQLEARMMLTGTPELLRDINQTLVSPEIQQLHEAGDVAYYLGETEDTGLELWITDGTSEGTRIVSDITPGPQDSVINLLHTFGDKTYFHQYGREGKLWVTDGTTDGTIQLMTGDVWNMIAVQDRGYFMSSSSGSPQLWVTDGTAAGTLGLTSGLTDIGNLLEYDGQLFFSTDEGLWSSTGSPDSTSLILELSGINGLYAIDGTLHITRSAAVGDTQVLHAEVWTSDGTGSGTELLFRAPQQSGSASSFIERPVKLRDQFFFQMSQCTSSGCTRSFGTSDGTQEGTKRLSGTFDRYHSQVIGNSLYYADRGGVLHVVDADTLKPERITSARVKSRLVPLGEKIYFSGGPAHNVSESVVPNGLYELDTTTAETTLSIEFRQSAYTPNSPFYLTEQHGTLYFVASTQNPDNRDDSSWSLWRSDGTQQNTEPLGEFDWIDEFGFVGESVVVIADSDGTRRLWNVSQSEPIPLSPLTKRTHGIVDLECDGYCVEAAASTRFHYRRRRNGMVPCR